MAFDTGFSKIRSKTFTTVTFNRQRPFRFNGMNPVALIDGAVTLEGLAIESLTLDMSVAIGPYPVCLQQVRAAGARDVEITGSHSRQMRYHKT